MQSESFNFESHGVTFSRKAQKWSTITVNFERINSNNCYYLFSRRERLKSALYLRLIKSKGGPFGDQKFSKSRTMPKKN